MDRDSKPISNIKSKREMDLSGGMTPVKVFGPLILAGTGGVMATNQVITEILVLVAATPWPF